MNPIRRPEDMSIDLVATIKDMYQSVEKIERWLRLKHYLEEIEKIHKIHSRQAAAIAIQTAIVLFK
jgi:hypothetical protein